MTNIPRVIIALKDWRQYFFNKSMNPTLLRNLMNCEIWPFFTISIQIHWVLHSQKYNFCSMNGNVIYYLFYIVLCQKVSWLNLCHRFCDLKFQGQPLIWKVAHFWENKLTIFWIKVKIAEISCYQTFYWDLSKHFRRSFVVSEYIFDHRNRSYSWNMYIKKPSSFCLAQSNMYTELRLFRNQ